MKQLFLNDNTTEFFFEDNTTLPQLACWIEEKILLNENNPFDLNEEHSCDVDENESYVLIIGDEDMVEAKLVEVEIQKLLIKTISEEKTYIHGISDDLIEVEGNISVELDRYVKASKGIRFVCSDGTAGTIKLDSSGDWKIKVFQKGSKFEKYVNCKGIDKHTEDVYNFKPYSDILIFEEGLEWIIIDGEKHTKV